MVYAEIVKYFGAPLEEIAKPKTISGIKSIATLNGIAIGAIILVGAAYWAYTEGKLDNIIVRLANNQKHVRPPFES